ncbi:type II CAAX endopeptidase family protein [Dermatophilus congolensis]|uniref:type II CAAX endopeptidase family protein n=2 Tax=Dermatophilus congolensis TaxID=1863 RepID=UPI001AAE536E|nr:type II CAAX endopeptidase family protein [Dermatophilus congolensis]MBO3142249.1 CPBP family intramembrane metalloprotease [Dermatophilus congolensis]MBO3151240.1 CPBP family intramembrane metalloprotease [Dermatophilus congolensis]MBO3161756.1 CPBP family intramembrane metalloprotease [Dermatophilus congolensis]MBO3162526.1 CPBP family intramembrane metalloprotease [Dermatophilus congolensis]MBO3182838.1 CPBP family intramembrane metalloprotease [Dermatophilus congolensis]
MGELRRFIDAALFNPVPDTHPTPTTYTRRRVTAALTLALGTSILAISLRIPPGDPSFHWATLALALTWIAGAAISGPIYAGHAWTRKKTIGSPIIQSLTLAAILIALFLTGALAIAHIPALRDPVDNLLNHASGNNLLIVAFLTLINGIGEELYFRGALYDALPPGHAVAISTIIYVLVTATSGIPLLILAALLLGAITGLQRRVTGGILGPIIVHCCWSGSMLFLLPPLLQILR